MMILFLKNRKKVKWRRMTGQIRCGFSNRSSLTLIVGELTSPHMTLIVSGRCHHMFNDILSGQST